MIIIACYAIMTYLKIPQTPRKCGITLTYLSTKRGHPLAVKIRKICKYDPRAMALRYKINKPLSSLS